MIFDKNKSGSAELFAVTGIFEKSILFSEIRPDIILATEKVCRLIGREVYENAETAYLDNREDTLIEKVQMPIAFFAVKSYFETNTVSHGSGGRKVKVSEGNEKLAWQWMIDQDSAMLERKAYHALDILIQYLEAKKLTEWLNAPIRCKIAACWVKNIDDFENVFPIDRSFYFFYTLVPLMIEAQTKWFRPILKDRFDSFETDIDMEGVLSLAKKVVPLLTIVIAVRRLSVAVLPEGVVRRFTPGSQSTHASEPLSPADAEKYTALILSDINEKIAEIQQAVSLISGEYDNYPLIPENDARNKFMRT